MNEPVAWMYQDDEGRSVAVYRDTLPCGAIPLYTHPVKEWNRAKDRFPNYETICLQCGTTIYKPFKELTDEEIEGIARANVDGHSSMEQLKWFARAILKKASEK